MQLFSLFFPFSTSGNQLCILARFRLTGIPVLDITDLQFNSFSLMRLNPRKLCNNLRSPSDPSESFL